MNQNQIKRLIDSDSALYKVDIYGDQLSIMWFAENPPTEEYLKSFDVLTHESGAQHWFCRQMINRGQNPNAKQVWKSANAKDVWVAEENGLKFELRLNEGQSPGLFVDQRRNRQTVLEKAKGKKMLNLFSYTGGFSVAAALGGASQVTTVDVSNKYIEWSKVNFTLNGINLSPHEFWSVDVRDFLEGCIRRKRFFDLIICDPPSFGRSSRGAFRIEKEFSELIELCSDALNPKGELLFCTNYEGWDSKDFEKKLYVTAKSCGLIVQNFPTPESDITSDIMKCAWLQST